MREPGKYKVSAASIHVLSYVLAKKVYPARGSVDLVVSKRVAKELARDLLIVAFAEETKGDVVITGHQDLTVRVLGQRKKSTSRRKVLSTKRVQRRSVAD